MVRPCAPRIHHKIKKEAKDEALRDSRRGGGGGHDGKNGNFKKCKDDKRGPHYHGLDRKGDHIPPHHYYPKSVVVSKGDTLWSISQRYGVDCKKLQNINGIKDPKKLMPGQVIKFA